jgi:hypothetical protein
MKSRTTLLGIANGIIFLIALILFMADYIDSEQMTNMILGVVTISTSLIGYFTKDDKKKLSFNLTDAVFLAELQDNAEKFKKLTAKIAKSKNNIK